MKPIKTIALGVLLICTVYSSATSAQQETLDRWLAHQVTIDTWQADVTQIRRIKNLTNELQNPGFLKFIKPNKFRWELGNPLRTLAIRDGEQLLIAYPRLQQAERYPFDKIQDPAMKQALLLLEVGFPSDSNAFYAQYHHIETTHRALDNGEKIAMIKMEPINPGAKQLLKAIVLEIAEDTLYLVANELHFSDGSSLRNQFEAQKFNVKFPETILETDLAGYQISEPLSQLAN